jgi:hypothetical protein
MFDAAAAWWGKGSRKDQPVAKSQVVVVVDTKENFMMAQSFKT